MALAGKLRRLGTMLRREPRFVSSSHWENRYRVGGDSGAGSYGRLATFKAEFLNKLVAEKGWRTVLEMGCGDGAQLALADYLSYVGVDVSSMAVELCRQRFVGRDDRAFVVSGQAPIEPCDVGLSLDVIYHLVEDSAFEQYMIDLVGHSMKAVVLYTSDSDVFTPPRTEPPHIQHRPVQRWMAERYPELPLTSRVANPYPWNAHDQDNTSFADFYIYERDPVLRS